MKDNREGINLFTNLAYSEGDNTTDNVPLTSVNPFEIKYGIGFNSANNKFSSKLTNTHVGKQSELVVQQLLYQMLIQLQIWSCL